jgi:hypothetical protein
MNDFNMKDGSVHIEVKRNDVHFGVLALWGFFQ